MAYQKCVNEVIILLKSKYPTIIWDKSNDNQKIIFGELLKNLGKRVMPFNDEMLIELHNEVYKGITKINYKVPLMDMDIDPNLRQFNEYDKDYDECDIELENGEFKFNLP
jgi:hypothetical protein